MRDDTKGRYYYEPEGSERLSTAVVTAVAQAHEEDVIDQKWLISDDINTDALDGLFQNHNLDMTLQFEADGTTATIVADRKGNPRITIESHR
jgi:ABC-type hemin transport system ATPase subunit